MCMRVGKRGQVYGSVNVHWHETMPGSVGEQNCECDCSNRGALYGLLKTGHGNGSKSC